MTTPPSPPANTQWQIVEQTNETTTEWTPWCEGTLVRVLFHNNKGLAVAIAYCPSTPGGKS